MFDLFVVDLMCIGMCIEMNSLCISFNDVKFSEFLIGNILELIFGEGEL